MFCRSYFTNLYYYVLLVQTTGNKSTMEGNHMFILSIYSFPKYSIIRTMQAVLTSETSVNTYQTSQKTAIFILFTDFD